jgi:hypothetical protein
MLKYFYKLKRIIMTYFPSMIKEGIPKNLRNDSIDKKPELPMETQTVGIKSLMIFALGAITLIGSLAAGYYLKGVESYSLMTGGTVISFIAFYKSIPTVNKSDNFDKKQGPVPRDGLIIEYLHFDDEDIIVNMEPVPEEVVDGVLVIDGVKYILEGQQEIN